MSFGFSVGDFLAGATLAYTLGKALSDSQGSVHEYKELIAELNVVNKVLIHVEQLRATNQLAQSTVNALLFAVNASNEAIESFLHRQQAYIESFRDGGSGNIIKDVYRKGKWATVAPEHTRTLRATLAAMLGAINCLVSMATYYNTGYDPRCSASLEPEYETRLQHFSTDTSWEDLKLEGKISGGGECHGFAKREDSPLFFRPGQIFAVRIESSLFLRNYRSLRKVNFGELPLDDIPSLNARAASEHIEDKKRRLAQLHSLPLHQMTAYCRPVLRDNTKVECSLCRSGLRNNIWTKEEWVDHFRFNHWTFYFTMRPERNFQGLYIQHKKLINKINLEQPRPSIENILSVEKWITIDDITHDHRVMTDKDLVEAVNSVSVQDRKGILGPTMIQRFVVIREGMDSCLCLGIHTYARRGCAEQPDQALFGMLHSGKEVPAPLPGETGMVLSPIRMKPDHPSTALPKSARLHFGRAYQISHRTPVEPLGLVHQISMEVLMDQFEANVAKLAPETNVGDKRKRTAFEGRAEPQEPDPRVTSADLGVVREIRRSIAGVMEPSREFIK